MKFSIITPVYNVLPYLRHCLDSVIMQSFQDWELICVDDGSTDGSSACLDDYALSDKRIRVIHQSNMGVGAARNQALSQVLGDWFLFLDGDDVLTANALECFCRLIDANAGVDLVSLGMFEFSRDTDLAVQFPIRHQDDYVHADSHSIASEVANRGFTQFAYRTSRLCGIRFEDYICGEDRLFLWQCLFMVDKVAWNNVPVYGYRQRMGSAIHQGLSFHIWRDLLDHRIAMLDFASGSEKGGAPRLLRLLINSVTESAVGRIGELPKEDQKSAWKMWFGRLKQFRTWKFLSVWHCFALFCCSTVRWHCIPYVLYGIPYGLKKRGVHR